MMRNNKQSILTRPNLKMFLLAAMGSLVVQQLLSSGNPDQAIEFTNQPPHALEMQKRLDRTFRDPSVENYLILSESYRLRGENQKALHFLRKARLVDDIDL